MRRILFCLVLVTNSAFAAMTPQEKASQIASFELVWSTVRDRNPDPTMNGLDWQSVHDSYKSRVENADSVDVSRAVVREMISKLGLSHFGIIPESRYAASTGNVEFGNLPKSQLVFESRKLEGGAGYIRFNEFLDPVTLMPKFEAAMRDFAKAPGVILDLRGNPGGIGIMAMGIAGFFVSESGVQLGEMKMKDTTLKFTVSPRAEVYAGKLAVLIDGGSASTTEILAQGLQDLKRARIFGTRSAGAALVSDVIRLPDGDGFQFPTASYTSRNGRVLEGNGVVPDVAVSDHDSVIDAAAKWISQP
jgi:C-terminal processing protease CtpA/Prc